MEKGHRIATQPISRGNKGISPREGPPEGKWVDLGNRRVMLWWAAAAAALSVAAAVGMSACTICYSVVDQQGRLAYVGGAETFQRAVDQVEAQVSDLLRTEYQVEGTTVLPAIALRTEVQSEEQLADTLLESVDQVAEYAVLTIDGAAVGVCEERRVIEEALDLVQAQYRSPNTLTSYFENTVNIETRYLPLCTPEEDPAALADKIRGETTQEGRPILSVCTVEEVTTLREISPEVTVQPDETRYTGERVVLQEGTPGQEEVTQRIVYSCGQERSRETYAVRVCREATPTLVAVGTADGSVPLPGYFAWPCTGRISSNFGSRYLFGYTSFHSGLDIADEGGTAIYAAADGIVAFAGEKGSYGNLLQLDHGNGFLTYYGHCATVLVAEGTWVAQGQEIAKMGSTGRSTGPHCHFEIRWQNVPMDPRPYLP